MCSRGLRAPTDVGVSLEATPGAGDGPDTGALVPPWSGPGVEGLLQVGSLAQTEGGRVLLPLT